MLKSTTSLTGVIDSRFAFSSRLRAFAADTSGNMSYLAIVGSLVMMVFGGVGIDMMHAELKRIKVQNTLDRAVLAAANIENTIAPQQVVEEYFAAMGLGEALTSIDVEQSMTAKRVSAIGQSAISSDFMSLIGVDTLDAFGRATAEHATANIEISMVLDVSGSMGWNSKIINMRNAARSFVDIMMPEDGQALTTISIVPYNATVNLGATTASYFTLDDLHDYSNCVTFDQSDFDQAAISPSEELTRLAHFDLNSTNVNSTEIASPWCRTGDTSAVIAHRSDPATLKAHIDSLNAGGNTAIDLGMKWGAALLDPAARPAIAAMSDDGLVDPDFAVRPASYADPESSKYVVIMTDGENTTQYDLKPQHKYGYSDVWIDERGNSDPSDDRFSLRVVDNTGSDNDTYFWQRYEGYSSSYRYRGTPDGGSNARRMTNAELFARFGTRAVGSKMYQRPYYDGYVTYSTYSDIYYAYEATVGADPADNRLESICDAAKAQGVVVFAIGFEAPQRGLDAMRNCASSPAHFFDVNGADLEETFASIANTITQLRLTQ
ncbi:putative Flp pilus-assembly TadE/G-like protein [Antarctobacter heliothermus]|uniref:Putative Flp pilus-assembly TadE/G-like protein n=1 Tax=Antarctobacter heliothermus TaxID=74033 RepID=A0A222E3U3_9RHOB|nr:TadE/TadG family type IV pilus assembly protein [Antarctobacter heliothermus]ASP20879.1 putative Flp pilus-assembly TadE/G-like protein [Antarctobacter heliothermus]